MNKQTIVFSIVFLLAVSFASADSTGFLNWTTYTQPHTVDWTTPGDGGLSDNAYANGAAGAQIYWANFNRTALPSGSTITGITLTFEFAASSNTGTNELFYRIGNGTAWSVQNTTGDKNGGDSSITVGSSVDTWGLVFTDIALLSVNTTSGATSTRTMRIDTLEVDIAYSPPAVNFTGVNVNGTTANPGDSLNFSTTVLSSNGVSTTYFAWNATGASCDGGYANITNWTSLESTPAFRNATLTIPSGCVGRSVGWFFMASGPYGTTNTTGIYALNASSVNPVINVTVSQPPNNTLLNASQLFNFTATVKCYSASGCEVVSARPTFNGSGGEPSVYINSSSTGETPFFYDHRSTFASDSFPFSGLSFSVARYYVLEINTTFDDVYLTNLTINTSNECRIYNATPATPVLLYTSFNTTPTFCDLNMFPLAKNQKYRVAVGQNGTYTAAYSGEYATIGTPFVQTNYNRSATAYTYDGTWATALSMYNQLTINSVRGNPVVERSLGNLSNNQEANVSWTLNFTAVNPTEYWLLGIDLNSTVVQNKSTAVLVYTSGDVTYDINFSIWNGSGWIDALSEYMEFRCNPSHTSCQPTNQDVGSSQSIYQVCNNGTGALTGVTMYMSATCANIALMCDDDYTVTGATTLSTSEQTIAASLAVNACTPVSCWADYANPTSGCVFDTFTNFTY